MWVCVSVCVWVCVCVCVFECVRECESHRAFQNNFKLNLLVKFEILTFTTYIFCLSIQYITLDYINVVRNSEVSLKLCLFPTIICFWFCIRICCSSFWLLLLLLLLLFVCYALRLQKHNKLLFLLFAIPAFAKSYFRVPLR